ncbi:MAG: competence/damage-inducible protein A [Bacteroidales bacterium]|nr:competence/damage-inducible protein A [Bacteroidales bacterium]MDP2237678.1 competence/damage-inducible protein A [Bacteroidales bacterium]
MHSLKREVGAAEIISIGDELLIGQVINSNASWMGEQLFLSGVPLRRVTTIGDNEQDLHEAIDAAIERVQFVFLTGGLGPTSDDITKPSLCNYFNVQLEFNTEAFQQVEALFARRGMPVTERNRLQAMLPENCRPVQNMNGTAPGMWFEHEGAEIVSMPGVPFEMKPMLTEQVIPTIKKRFQTSNFFFKTIMTTGVGESFLADRIKDWENNLPKGFKLAYLPQPGLVRLRLGGEGADGQSVLQTLNRLVDELTSLLPEYVYGYDNQPLEVVVGQKLKDQLKTVATAESCTGGYIAHLLTSIPGSSAWFKGAVVAYSNEIKTGLLGVPVSEIEAYGAVSSQVAEAMATGLLERFGTDYALAVTGIAGPDGGTAEKPVGTVWVAVADKSGVNSQRFQLGEQRDRNIRRSALSALNMLRLKI